jgi:hypothetical protein
MNGSTFFLNKKKKFKNQVLKKNNLILININYTN